MIGWSDLPLHARSLFDLMLCTLVLSSGLPPKPDHVLPLAHERPSQAAFTICDDRRKYVRMSKDGRGSSKRKGRRYTVDSGASVHCINDASLFDTVYDSHPQVRITVANKQVIHTEKVGTVKLRMIDQQGKLGEVTLHNVCYHPNFTENLLSVSRLWKDNRIATLFSSKNIFVDMVTGDRYRFEHSHNSYQTPILRAKVELDPHLLHSRFGHCSERRLNKLRDRSINFPHHGDGRLYHDPTTCDACQQGGSKRQPTGKRPKGRYTYFGEKLSSDLCQFPKSLEGYKYVLCIVDACTNWLVTVPLKSKGSDEVKAAFESFLKKYAHALPTRQPVTWHTDNRGEFYE